jgi:predicted RNA binding protein with dsRBD fold (UPF0201 family)
LPTIKETELLHPMLHSHKLKDLLEMQQKIKQLKIPSTLFSMPKGLLAENLTILSYKKIASFGHLKFNQDLMINQLLSLNIKVKLRNSTLKKFLQWF